MKWSLMCVGYNGVMHCAPNVAHLQTQQQLKTRRNRRRRRHNDSGKWTQTWTRNVSSFRNPTHDVMIFSFGSKIVNTHVTGHRRVAWEMRHNKTTCAVHPLFWISMHEGMKWNLLRAANVNNNFIFCLHTIFFSLHSNYSPNCVTGELSIQRNRVIYIFFVFIHYWMWRGALHVI